MVKGGCLLCFSARCRVSSKPPARGRGPALMRLLSVHSKVCLQLAGGGYIPTAFHSLVLLRDRHPRQEGMEPLKKLVLKRH
jgi:hypothetical protein